MTGCGRAPIPGPAARSRSGCPLVSSPRLPAALGRGSLRARPTAILLTGIVDVRDGVRTLLRRFLIWRVGMHWYLVVLLGPAAIYLAALALHLALGGDLGQPLIHRILPAMSLAVALPLFFLIDLATNGEE